MEWTQFVILVLAMGGMFYWNRTEARADSRKADLDNKELRRELIEVMRSMDTEMRDFHGRLCAIEERARK
jgi:Flp pilus assembly protein TadB